MPIKITLTYICDGCGLVIKNPRDSKMVITNISNFYFHNNDCFLKWPQREYFEDRWGQRFDYGEEE